MKFRAAVGEYVQDRQSQGRLNSRRSVDAYVSKLNALADAVDNRDPRLVGRDDIKRVLRRWAPSSQAQARSIYISFFRWCMQEGHATTNPAELTTPPRVKSTPRYRLTADETHAVAEAVSNPREARVVHLAVFAGLRNQELRGAQGRHFQRPGWIWVSKDIAKGGRERWIPVIPQLEPVIAEIRANVEPDHYVLPTRVWADRHNHVLREIPDTPVWDSTLNKIVKQVAKRAGIHADIAAHSLRHAFCDHVRRMTGDIGVVRALMGHANLQTTQGYMSQPTLDELAAAVAIRYPRENGSELPTATGIVPNGPSHSVAAESELLFWLGEAFGRQAPAIDAYVREFAHA